MVKVRLKAESPYPKLVTPFGVITKDWTEVSERVPIYNDMEVFKESKPKEKLKIEAVAPVVEEVEESEKPTEKPEEEFKPEKPKVKKNPKKKKKKRVF